jgi:REP element-mobilizing transposase RayT
MRGLIDDILLPVYNHRMVVRAGGSYLPDHPPPRRSGLRLDGYDYAQAGAYFVTICTAGRACLLGHITDGQMILSDIGEMIHRAWGELPEHCQGIAIDEFVVMPNHVHGIVAVTGEPPCTTALSEIVRRFKTLTTKKYREQMQASQGQEGRPCRLWQRNYYDHVVRSDVALTHIRQYIVDNPMKWEMDEENPERRTARRDSRSA